MAAATLAQPMMGLSNAFSQQNLPLTMNQDDSSGDSLKDSESQDVGGVGSSSNSSVLPDNSSDEEIKSSYKKSRRKSAKQLVSDDSEDDVDISNTKDGLSPEENVRNSGQASVSTESNNKNDKPIGGDGKQSKKFNKSKTRNEILSDDSDNENVALTSLTETDFKHSNAQIENDSRKHKSKTKNKKPVLSEESDDESAMSSKEAFSTQSDEEGENVSNSLKSKAKTRRQNLSDDESPGSVSQYESISSKTVGVLEDRPNSCEKKSRKKSKRAVLSDDSDIESSALVSGMKVDSTETKDDSNLRLEMSENNESSDESEMIIRRKSSKTKSLKKKKTRLSKDSDSDDDEALSVSRTTTRRRLDKDRQSQSSDKGSAIQKLIKLRKKKRGEKLKDSDQEGQSTNDKKSSDSEQKLHKKPARSSFAEGQDNSDDNRSKNEEELFQDSSSQSSMEDDDENKLSKPRKFYGTRGKSALARDDSDDDEKEVEPINLLNNPELFDAEGSDSGSEDGKRLDEGSDNPAEHGVGKKRKRKSKREDKPKRPSKAEILATQSEQQRMQRNATIHIPCHEPSPVSIHQFLGRVPKLNSLQRKPKIERKIEAKEETVIDVKDGSSQAVETLSTPLEKKELRKLSFTGLPKLSKTSDEIVLDDEEIKPMPTPPPSGLDVFMQRLRKHAITPKPKAPAKKVEKEEIVSEASNTKKAIINKEKIEKAADTPGSRHMELKKQLQEEMRIRREASRKEAEIRHKLENEEFSEEEKDFEDAEEESEEDDEMEGGEDVEGSKKKSRKLLHQENDDSADEDDEELQKWNVEDERKQIETQLDDLDDIDQEYAEAVRERQNNSKEFPSFDENTTASARTVGSSVDLFPNVRHDEEGQSSDQVSCSLNLELKDNTDWDESNTIPPGQGDSFRIPSRVEANTPFSKLLKSGLFSSRRHSSLSEDMSYSGNRDQRSSITSDESSMMPPIEDSQSLYRDDDNQTNANISGHTAAVISDDLHFILDENTQFSQILDTQGYFNPGGKEKKKPKPKSLFDADDGSSVSQLLGLCSGNFEKTQARTSMNDDNFGLPSDLPSDLPCDKEEDNSQEFLGLCSGRFTTQACADTDSVQFKKPSIDLVGKESNESGNEFMGHCSRTSVNSTNTQELSRPLFEESKSSGSLMSHFKRENCVALEGRRSFDNLFGSKNAKDEIRDSDDKIEMDDDNVFDDDSGQRKKIFFIGSDENSRHSSQNESSISDKKNEDANRDKTENLQSFRKIENDVRKEERKCIDEDGSDEDVHDEVDEGEDDVHEDGEEDDDAESDKEANEDAGEDEDNDDVEEGDADEYADEELQEYYETLPKKKFSKKHFYEHEAELSGSDVGDDEDDDFGSEADEYEEESDIEELPSRAKLKAQAHNAHMKLTMEDDKQEIRYIQERFYEDGDLISDGNGRKRNFRWRNIDQPSQMAPTEADGSENEAEEEQDLGSQQEVNKRIERLEREAFLEEQRKSQEKVFLDENSQSILNIIKTNHSESSSSEISRPSSQPVQTTSLRRSGSFLERSKNTLSRLSLITSTGQKPNAPARSFVFQSKSTSTSTENEESSKPYWEAKRKPKPLASNIWLQKEKNDRSSLNFEKMRRSLSEIESPAPKKAKLDRSLSSHGRHSIFKHF